MEIAQSLLDAAAKILKYEVTADLPKQLGDTKFFLAKAEDTLIMGFGVIKSDEGIEYKIGPKKAE